MLPAYFLKKDLMAFIKWKVKESGNTGCFLVVSTQGVYIEALYKRDETFITFHLHHELILFIEIQ